MYDPPEEEKYETVRVDTPSVRTDLESPSFTQYQDVTGMPYAASYYGLDRIFNELEQADRTQLKNIDNFLAKNVAFGVEDSPEAVSQVMKDLESKLGLKDYHTPYYKLSKISDYLDLMSDENPTPILPSPATQSDKQIQKIVKKVERVEKIVSTKPAVNHISQKIDKILKDRNRDLVKGLEATLRSERLERENQQLKEREGKIKGALSQLLQET